MVFTEYEKRPEPGGDTCPDNCPCSPHRRLTSEQAWSFSRYKKDQKPGKAVWQQKDNQMGADYESSATQLHTSLLISHGHNLSLSTVLRCRTTLGLTFCGSTYCQLMHGQQSSTPGVGSTIPGQGWPRFYGHYMDRRMQCSNGEPP